MFSHAGLHARATKKASNMLSLSTLAQSVLGRPLDKSVRASDWSRRPLSEQQMKYCALDAQAALLIFRGLCRLNSSYRTRTGLLPYAFTWRSGGPKEGISEKGEEESKPNSDGDGGFGSRSLGGSGNASNFGQSPGLFAAHSGGSSSILGQLPSSSNCGVQRFHNFPLAAYSWNRRKTWLVSPLAAAVFLPFLRSKKALHSAWSARHALHSS
jgi:hypothetical protein